MFIVFCVYMVQVQGLLLDPSCSGSGTVYSRMDHLLPSWQTKHARQSVGAKQQQKGLRDGVQQGEAGDTGDGTGQDASSGQGGAEGDERARITQLATFQVGFSLHLFVEMKMLQRAQLFLGLQAAGKV
jgi:hypothetical protein